ncbi:hypothetical protein BDR22DRAFT_828993 [Usnea florida]
MSIIIDWPTLTTGPSGLALAASIRDFIHEKFQQVTLPRFIRSVHVHSFDFGDECPVVELKDISDPLPEFYENEKEDGEGEEREGSSSGELDEDEDEEPAVGGAIESPPTHPPTHPSHRLNPFTPPTQPSETSTRHHPNLHLRSTGLSFPPQSPDHIGSRPLLSRSNTTITTPGVPIPGGTSNFTSYFHLPLSAGLSGTQTPLLLSPWGEQPRPPSPSRREQHHSNGVQGLSSTHHADAAVRQRTTGGGSKNPNIHHPSQQNHNPHTTLPHKKDQNPKPRDPHSSTHSAPLQPLTPPEDDRSQDLQTTLHISYSGSLSLSLTAEILLDYPMPSFVGIPLKLQITGLSFDGVALLAYLRHSGGSGGGEGDDVEGEEGERERRKVQFCFLGREDARIMLGEGVGGGDDGDGKEEEEEEEDGVGGLLREIRVESEIGRQEGGKQVLKNVGKVERFVLEQVRRIFEEEFVWPSFWTFLV